MQNLELVQLKKLKVNISDEVGISRLQMEREETSVKESKLSQKREIDTKTRLTL